MADYNALFQAPNAGAAFANALQNAQQMRQQQAERQMQMQEHMQDRQRLQQQDVQAQLERHRENIVRGAQLIRQINPQDDASWQSALRMAQQAGIDISEVPQHYDPQYAQGLMKLADTFAPAKQNEAPNSVREFEYAKNNGFQGSYLDFVQTLHPPAPVVLPPNATVSGGGPQGHPITATGPNGQKIQFNQQSGQWEPIGGQAASPPATFP